jgi:hypothetical protein
MNRPTIANSAARILLLGALVLIVSLIPGKSVAWGASGQSQQRTSSEGSYSMKINLKIGNKILTARLADNATAREFVSLLPLNLSMNDLFGREKYGDLPRPISESGPRKNRYEVGEIAYWSPGHQVAVYYHQDGEAIPSPGVIPIAKLDAGTEAFNVPGSVEVTIEVAK